jgi:two-component system, OmpR family, response regulator
MDKEMRIFLVDDDALFLKSLEIDFLQFPEYTVETYATGELCLKHISHNPDVIVLDYHLDGINKDAINGIETLDRIKAHNPDIPVIMLSSQDKIEVAVNCMHHKAYYYVTKSETASTRLRTLISALQLHKKTEQKLKWYMSKM